MGRYKGINMSKNDKGYIKIASILSEFKVSSESGLLEKMTIDALTLDCISCRKKIIPDKAIWINGDPYCSKNCKGYYGKT